VTRRCVRSPRRAVRLRRCVDAGDHHGRDDQDDDGTRVARPTGTLHRTPRPDVPFAVSSLDAFSHGPSAQRMDELTTRPPTVPLEAGASPDKTPCPPAASRSSGWLPSRSGLGAPVRRSRPVDSASSASRGTEEALATLDRLGDQERARIVNRASFSCSLSRRRWAGSKTGRPLPLHGRGGTAARRRRDQVVRRRRWAPARACC